MYHILFGFDDEATIKAIIRIVKKQIQQDEIAYSIQTTKDAIQEYIQYQPECDTIVLREVMDNESWSAEELAALNDRKTYNILVVIEKKHKGTEYVQTLYTAGITSAFLIENGEGVRPEEIAHYIIHPRNRATARKVYGMDSIKVPVNVLTSDLYLKKYAYLMDDSQGAGLLDRYLIIVKDMSVKVAVEFTKKLPPNIIKKLADYEEFWKVKEYFDGCGFKLKINKPKQLRKAMTDESFKALMKRKKNEKQLVDIPDEYKPNMYKEDPELSEKDPSVKEEVKPASNDYFDHVFTLFEDNAFTGNSTRSKEQPGEYIGNNETAVAEETASGTSTNTGSSSIPSSPNNNQENVTIKKDIPQKATRPSEKVAPSNNSTTKKKIQKGKVEVVKTSSSKKTTDKKQGKKQKNNKKSRINWKLVISILIIAILLLVIFYFSMRLSNII